MPVKSPAASTAKSKPTSPSKKVERAVRNDQLLVTIDTKKKERFLATSVVASLRTWEATEAELYAEVTKRYPKYTLKRIMREGARTLARRKIAEANSVKMRGQTQSPGSADKRLAKAYERIQAFNVKATAEGRPLRKVTAWTLSVAANPRTSWRTAERWISENVPPAKPLREVSAKR